MSAFHPKADIQLKWVQRTATDPKRTLSTLDLNVRYWVETLHISSAPKSTTSIR